MYVLRLEFRFPPPQVLLNSSHASSQHVTVANLKDDRAESLRLMAHRKMKCIDFDSWMDRFVRDPEGSQPSPALPAGTRPTVRRTAVSIVSRLRPRSRSTFRAKSGSEFPSSALQAHDQYLNPFEGMRTYANEKDMYRKITDALNKAHVCPGFQFVSTPSEAERTDASRQAVGCGMYPDDALDRLKVKGWKRARYGRTDWSSMEILILCKNDGTNIDPFDELCEPGEPNAVTRRAVLDQFLSHAELLFDHQHRKFQFAILFLGNRARIACIDRSAILATTKFDYRTSPEKLAEFLWLVSHLHPERRGHDTTAVRLDPNGEDARMMRRRVEQVQAGDYAGELFRKHLDPQWAWWKLAVHDELDGGKPHHFLVGKPHFQASGVVGRTTRCYVALPAADPLNSKFVYLKDAWRVDSTDIEKEGDVLEELREHDVPFVPTLVHHGDLPGQTTENIDIWEEVTKEKASHLKKHQHYRLVVKEVGKSLDEFRDAKQLTSVMLCCVLAHSEAYKIGIIHRDISAGNILLHKGEDGGWAALLNDWELSKKYAQKRPESRQPDRTGTWQFMSVAALDDHQKEITVQDELESFFHVLLYEAIRLLHHNLCDASVLQFLHDYYDLFHPGPAGEALCGPIKSQVMSDGVISLERYQPLSHRNREHRLRFTFRTYTRHEGEGSEGEEKPVVLDRPHPLDQLFERLLSWFSAYHRLKSIPETVGGQASDSQHNMPDKSIAPAEGEVVAQYLARRRRRQASGDRIHSTNVVAKPSGQDESAVNKAKRAELEALAKNLESHEPMMNLLEDALDDSQIWPSADRYEGVKDRKPPKGRKPLKVDLVPKSSAITTGQKRGSEVLGGTSGSAPKRSRH